MAVMWNVLAGYGGLVSVGQQAFIGFGAYATVFISQSSLPGIGTSSSSCPCFDARPSTPSVFAMRRTTRPVLVSSSSTWLS